MRIQVFVDLVDPWSWLAVTRLERAVAAHTLRTGEPVEVVLRSFQLDPQAPSDHQPLLEALAERLGGPEHAAEQVERVAEAARPDGLEFDFEAAVRANTFDAHRLLSWASAAGGAGAQRDLAHELWRAHFGEGADLADHDTLASRAAAVGLDADAADVLLASDDAADQVDLQLTTAAQAGITQVPTVIVDGTYAVPGVQTEDAYLQVLDRLAGGAADGIG
ncbi:DsbA family oxidoreductase [Solicola sp. PLA-1-18]|uniref:DsbA family oxidoreductase n=1 Tax=Solicola sp. PLA-1-18 TaxID=3380532 RepID=UPI003B7C0974